MENNKKITPKRLLIDISLEEHRDIKAMAALKNIPMRKYVLRAVMRKIEEDKKLLEK